MLHSNILGTQVGSVALSVFHPNRSLISLKKNCQELLTATEPTAVLNNDLQLHFERWYPELKIVNNVDRPAPRMKKAA